MKKVDPTPDPDPDPPAPTLDPLKQKQIEILKDKDKKSPKLPSSSSVPKIRFSKRTEHQMMLTPSFRFFGAKIRGHAENAEEKETPRKSEGATTKDKPTLDKDDQDNQNEEDDEPQKFVESTEIIFKHGRVIAIAVDKDFLAIVNEAKGPHHFCLCCSDQVFDISPELRHSIKAQARLLDKILLIENCLHLVTLGSMAAQCYTQSIHDFVYEQWAVITLFIVVNHITLIWSVMFSKLAAHHPADNILLVIKALTHSCLGMCFTALFERMIVKWVINRQDFPDAGALISLYRARKHWNYTYPLIVSAFLINLSIVNVVISIFLYFFRGNVKKDTMFWVALISQFALSSGQFAILYLHVKLGSFKLFHGPPEWDYSQLAISGIASVVWEQWRYYNLRLVLMGRKYDVNEKAYKRGALQFCI